jgi:hypothetical protein
MERKAESMTTKIATLWHDGRVRELGHGLLFLALTGSSVGGVMGLAVATTKALGR